MNLFVAVVMFVMVPLACGADVTWEIASPRDRALWNHPREENKTSNSNVNNDTHEQTGADSTQDRPAPRLRRPNAPPLTNIDNVGSAPSRKDVDKREYINPQEEANIIQRRANIIQWVMAALTFALVVLGCVIGRRQMEIMARQTSYMEAATRYAGDAARAAKESVEIASQSMRVANRAYLTLGWRKRDNRHIVKDAQFAGVCRVVNAGLTPARLIAQHFHCYLRKQAPPPIDRSQPLDLPLEMIDVGPRQELELSFHSEFLMTAEEYEAVKGGQLTLYVVLGIEFLDVFNQRERIVSWMTYDVSRDCLVVFTAAGYNYNTQYENKN